MNSAERRQTIWRIVIFSILVTAMAWLSPMLGGSPASPGPGFILWGAAPLLVSLVMRFVAQDWEDLGIRPVIRSNVHWYGINVVSIPVLMVLTLLFGVLMSISSMHDFSMGKYLQTALTALPFFFIFAIFEEFGWRGYLSPKLDSLGINRLAASAIVGVVWATWHKPYIRGLTWVYSSEDLVAFIPRFYLVCFVFSILYGEIRSITGSVWPAVLLHAVVNSFGHPLAAEYVTYAAGTEYLASISNGVILIVLTGMLGIAINRWRLKKSAL